MQLDGILERQIGVRQHLVDDHALQRQQVAAAGRGGAAEGDIEGEAGAFLAKETTIEVEILKGDQVIGTFSFSGDPAYISPVTPGKYMARFSNGRVLWEGKLTKEDLIWAFAFPEKDLAMAAETEPSQRETTKTITLLEGEIEIRVFAGLESGKIVIESGKGI